MHFTEIVEKRMAIKMEIDDLIFEQHGTFFCLVYFTESCHVNNTELNYKETHKLNYPKCKTHTNHIDNLHTHCFCVKIHFCLLVKTF